MATIDSPSIIREILLHNGFFSGDPQLYAIISYVNNWDKPTFAICNNPECLREVLSSPYIHSPILLWSRENELTKAGREFLTSFEEESE